MKRCLVGIRRPDATEPPGNGKQVPTVWFPSMATMAAVLSEDNRALLRLIRQAKPKTMTELAALSGRQVPNLSRTLRTMESYGLVVLTRHARQTRPTVLATEFLVVLD
ncbi:MarR family transcriptional regulator [Aromatoleum evansii]|uniref:HVO_A0114 family putative DNA-binding protein n=1 Tax=Aromatoleum evansii TaxID=59406 RepID=UPI0016ABDB38|nr:MarR family transcriptional regulator [Aromatoleum evansii]NMG32133.1 MarR family transcriptional regulator [Aromatoleum evansii]